MDFMEWTAGPGLVMQEGDGGPGANEMSFGCSGYWCKGEVECGDQECRGLFFGVGAERLSSPAAGPGRVRTARLRPGSHGGGRPLFAASGFGWRTNLC